MTNEKANIKTPPLPWHGGCQCSQVRYQLTEFPLTLYACHCTECQHQSSSAFGMSMRVPANALTITGRTALATRSDPAAPPMEGVFCPDCGTRIIHRRPNVETVNIKAGTLDETCWIKPVGHLWVRSAMVGFMPAAGPLVYDGQPKSYNALIEAWRLATNPA